jgi:chemotaxis signal transduction protein
VSDYVRRQLIFEVGDHLFAADAQAVCEVLEPISAATPIPGAVPGIHGLINLRGTLLVTGNLGSLLGLTPKPVAEPALVVFEHEERRVALEIDRVVDVTSGPDGDLDVDGSLLKTLGAREVVSGAGQFGQRPYFRLDMGAVFALVLERDQRGDWASARTEGGAG